MTNEHGLEPTQQISGAYLGVTERDFEIARSVFLSTPLLELRLMRAGGGYEPIYIGSYGECLAARSGFLAAVKLIGGK